MFLTINAQAQNVPAPATLTSQEVAAIKNALAQNPAASMGMTSADSTLFASLLESNNQPIITRVAQAGMLCGAHNEAGDSVRLYIIRTQAGFNLFNNTFFRVPAQKTVVDRSNVAKVDSAAIHSQFVEKQLEGKPRYRVEFQADQHDISDGKIVDKASDKFGLSLLGGATYQMGNGLNSFSGEIGFNYSISNASGRYFLMPELTGSLRLTKYNDNANNAGEKYWSFGTEATAFGGVALGTHGCHRIAIGAGLGWEHYQTDSQTRYYDDGSWDEMSSKGNYLYPQAKLRYMYDMYNGPLSFFGGIGIRQHKSVWQNSDSEKSWMPTFELGISVKLFRHVNSNR
jgi:hypothetical protein